MRKHPTIHRFIWLIILSTGIGSTTPLWAAQDTPAETNRPEPTVRDLIERKVKSEQATKQADAESAQIGVPEDPLGRGVPRSTVRGFFSVTKKRDYAQAAEYLDLRNLPAGITQADGPELARQLKIVLDRVLWIDLDLLSTSPDGDREDGLPMARDRIGRIKTEEGKTYDILLQRVPRGDGAYIWKFSSATAADIPDLYKEFGYGPFEAILPARLFDMSFLGIHAAAWAVVIILGILLYPVTLLIIWSLTYVVSRFHPELASDLTRFFTGPARLYIWTVLVRAVRHALIGTSITGGALERAHTLQLIALVWFLMRLVDFSLYRAGVTLDRKGLAGARVLLVPAARLVKVFALAGAILLWLDNVGYKVTTLLAGLSISGVAVALASQKSIENIFGAVTLYTARPVKVGDFCRFGDKMGTVEEIGLRATRIRTLERSIVTVANAEFAGMHLDNLSARDRFWYHPLLQLRYETTPDQIRYILVEVRKMLYAHPKVLSEPLHVRFQGFGEYSLNVEVFAYIGVTDYTESLEVAEDLNLRIMDIVAAAGSDFAFPAQIQYEVPGKMLDEERARTVADQVKDWKAKRTLYLPNFPKEKINEVKGSLHYPPEGSPQYTGAPA